MNAASVGKDFGNRSLLLSVCSPNGIDQTCLSGLCLLADKLTPCYSFSGLDQVT